METSLGFTFLIKPEFDDTGHFIGNRIKTQNTGLPDEIVMTLMKAWLRAVKDEYFNNIRSGMSF